VSANRTSSKTFCNYRDNINESEQDKHVPK